MELEAQTNAAKMQLDMKNAAATELSECKMVLCETQIELRKAEKRADEEKARALAAEERAANHEKNVAFLTTKREELQRLVKLERAEVHEWRSAFKKLWSEYQILAQATPKQEG